MGDVEHEAHDINPQRILVEETANETKMTCLRLLFAIGQDTQTRGLCTEPLPTYGEPKPLSWPIARDDNVTRVRGGEGQ